MRTVSGLIGATGIAIGPARRIDDQVPEVEPVHDPMAALQAAAQRVAQELEAIADDLHGLGRSNAAEIIEAQRLMAVDPMMLESVTSGIDDGLEFGEAIAKAEADLTAMFDSIDDPYLAARSDDVREVFRRIRYALSGTRAPDLAASAVPCIIVASDLGAGDVARLDEDRVLGLALERGGPTSHVAIIAQSLGIPAIVGTAGLLAAVNDGDIVIIDAQSGSVVVDPDHETHREALKHRDGLHDRKDAARATRGRAVEVDGERIQVAANVASVSDAERAAEVMADGSGLVRTELLFPDGAPRPSVDQQIAVYREIISKVCGTTVIRTFDFGGDKPNAMVDIASEENPFLGIRGARVYAHDDSLFEDQVEAIIRAAQDQQASIMLPMITVPAEFTALRATIAEIASRLDALTPRIGIMIEVPSIVVTLDLVINDVDFISVGSNDLSQYLMAADRSNPALGDMHDPLQPALVRTIAAIADTARGAGVPVSVCGQAAGDHDAAPLFVALGVNSLSVAPALVDEVRARLLATDIAQLRSRAGEFLALPNAESIRQFLAELESAT